MSSPAVRRVMAALVGETERVVTDLAVEIHAQLVEATPIDTGNAAANWLCAAGAPDVRTVGSRESVDRGSAAVSVGALVVAYKLEHGSAFVSNHVDYIRALDDRDPFVDAAIERAVTTVYARAA